jgi:hypothetical protein
VAQSWSQFVAVGVSCRVPFPSDAGNMAEKHARPELTKTGLFALAVEMTPMMIAALASRNATANQPRMLKDDLRFTIDSRFLRGAEKSRPEARPLVAREFRNRNETIATAFSREAWTYAAASRP